MSSNVTHKPGEISPERIWKHHRMLCREIGHRLLGTANDRRAAEYIEAHFKRCGLSTSSQKFNCPSWDHWGTSIHTGSGFEITPPEGGACMFSLPCDLKGEIVHVKTLDELKNADIRGKICVISDELRDDNIRPTRNPILLLIEEKAPLAVIVIDKIQKGFQTKVIRDPYFKVPVCAVSKNSGARLLTDGGTVSIQIKAQRVDSFSRNIFATNTEKDCKKIRVIAHYDTSSDTPGATDNGSGISTILEVAEGFMENGLDIPIEFIAFGGEEYAALGSNEYLKVHPDRIDNTGLVINVDAVGVPNSRSNVFTGGADENLKAIVRRQADLVGGYHEVTLDRMYLGSDHDVFYHRGIPTVFLLDEPETLIWDTNLDIPRNICLERLEDAARIALGTILEFGRLP